MVKKASDIRYSEQATDYLVLILSTLNLVLEASEDVLNVNIRFALQYMRDWNKLYHMKTSPLSLCTGQPEYEPSRKLSCPLQGPVKSEDEPFTVASPFLNSYRSLIHPLCVLKHGVEVRLHPCLPLWRRLLTPCNIATILFNVTIDLGASRAVYARPSGSAGLGWSTTSYLGGRQRNL